MHRGRLEFVSQDLFQSVDPKIRIDHDRCSAAWTCSTRLHDSRLHDSKEKRLREQTKETDFSPSENLTCVTPPMCPWITIFRFKLCFFIQTLFEISRYVTRDLVNVYIPLKDTWIIEPVMKNSYISRLVWRLIIHWNDWMIQSASYIRWNQLDRYFGQDALVEYSDNPNYALNSTCSRSLNTSRPRRDGELPRVHVLLRSNSRANLFRIHKIHTFPFTLAGRTLQRKLGREWELLNL